MVRTLQRRWALWGAFLLLMAVSVPIVVHRGGQLPDLLLTAGLCSVGPIAARWPRTGALAALLTVLLLLLLRPSYTAGLAILGVGMSVSMAVGQGAVRLGSLLALTSLAVTGKWALDVARGPVQATELLVGLAMLHALACAVGALLRAYEQRDLQLEQQRAAHLAALRRDVAKELHDTVCQSLVPVVLRSELALANLPSDHQVSDALREVHQAGRRADEQVRNLLQVLNTIEHEPRGHLRPTRCLATALAEEVARLHEAGLQVACTVTGELARVPAAQATAVAFALRELVSNVIKHGDRGHEVRLSLHVRQDHLSGELTNDIARRPRGRTARGFGLVGVQETIADVGGIVEAFRSEGKWISRFEVGLT